MESGRLFDKGSFCFLIWNISAREWDWPWKQSLGRLCNATCPLPHAGFFRLVPVACSLQGCRWGCFWSRYMCKFDIFGRGGVVITWWEGGKTQYKVRFNWSVPRLLTWGFNCVHVFPHIVCTHAYNTRFWWALLPSWCWLCPLVVPSEKLSSSASRRAWSAWKTFTPSTAGRVEVRHGRMHHCWGDGIIE